MNNFDSEPNGCVRPAAAAAAGWSWTWTFERIDDGREVPKTESQLAVRGAKVTFCLLWSVNSKITVSTTPKTFFWIYNSIARAFFRKSKYGNKWQLTGQEQVVRKGRCDSVNELRQKNGIWLTNDRVNKEKKVKEVSWWLEIFMERREAF